MNFYFTKRENRSKKAGITPYSVIPDQRLVALAIQRFTKELMGCVSHHAARVPRERRVDELLILSTQRVEISFYTDELTHAR